MDKSSIFLIVGGLLCVAMTLRFLATLHAGVMRWGAVRVLAGGLAAIVETLIAPHMPASYIALLFPTVVLLLGLYWRRTGQERELLEGLTAAVAVSAGALAVLLTLSSEPGTAAGPRLLFSAVVCGIGIMLGVELNKLRRRALDGGTFAVAIAGSFALAQVVPGPTAPAFLIASVTAVTLIMAVAFVMRWRDTLRELSDEARLGLFAPDDVKRIANPFRRLGSARWIDSALRRKFVMTSQDLAVRKTLQRGAEPQRARLLQLDILRLRMELQDLLAIGRDLLRHRDERGADAENADQVLG